MKSYEQFFAELKRRKVFKVAAVYGIVSFGVLQAADIMLPRLGLPDWTVTFMVAIVVLAFPVVLIIAWAFEVTPEGVKRTDAASPGEIEAIATAPASQRWPAGVLALVGVAALVAGTWWVARRTAPDADGAVVASPSSETTDARLASAGLSDEHRPSVAVLPFADMSAAGDQEYFGDGMTEEILNTLAKIRELRIAGRTSAFAYKGENKDLRQIGNELGVEYLVEGSVRKEGDQLRITAQLIDAEDGSHMWSESYDRQLENVFQIQREIAEAIAEELRVPLGLDDPGELVTPTGDLEAYDLYLAGRAQMRQRQESLAEAVRLFEAAVARDSNWAPAWAGLAEATELLAWYPEAWPVVPEELAESDRYTLELWDDSERAARRALELDPDNASALVALGSVLRNRRLWDESEAAYLRALASDPDNPEAHQQYSEMLLDVGRIAEGQRAAERAVQLDRIPIRVLWRAISLWADDRPAASIEVMQTGIREFPDFFFLEYELGTHYLKTARYRDLVDLSPFENPALRFRWDVPPGQEDDVVRRLRSGDGSMLPERWKEEPGIWMALGQPDSAIARFRARATWLLDHTAWVWDPELEPIRDEPAVEQAMQKLNLEGRTAQRTPRDEAASP